MRRTRRGGLSSLEGALLGLLAAKPQSGYSLRKAFQETPLGYFSDSPGSIYPALGRLKTRGWIAGRVDRGRSLRPKEIFALTRQGETALRAWLSVMPTRATVAHGIDEALLRFAFMHATLGPADTAAFLRALAAALEARLEETRAYARAHARDLPLSGRLALESGLDVMAAQLHWAQRAARQISAGIRRRPRPSTAPRS